MQNQLFVKGNIRSNLLSLTSGTIFAQVFSLIFYPILGRIFSPEEFGLLSILNVIAAIITVIASGKYEEAIIVTKNKIETINVAFLALCSAFIFCFLTSILIYFYSDNILTSTNQTYLQGWICLPPIISFFVIIYNVCNESCIKRSVFSTLAINRITNSASINLSKFLLGVLKFKGGLVHGELLGRGLSAFFSAYRWIKTEKMYFKYISLKKMRKMALFYRNFPKYIVPDQLIATFTYSLPFLFLSLYLGDKVLGYFAMAMNVSSIPMTFVGLAVMDVLKHRASSDYAREGNCREIYSKFLRKAIPLIIVLLSGFFYFLPSIFVFILGTQWRLTGEFVQILSVSVVLDFICAVLMPVWVIAKRQKNRFYWQISYFFIMLFAVILGSVIFNDKKIAVVCISVGRSIGCLISIYYTWMYSKGVYETK